MRSRLILYFILFFTIFCYGADLPKVAVETLKVSENYNRTLYGGRLEPKQLYKQFAPLSGFVTEVYVSEGTYVVKDQALIGITKRASGGVTYNPSIVRAVSAGIVVRIEPSIGQEVFEKSEILSIADNSSFMISLYVSDKDIGQIKTGDTAYLENDNKATGKITKISLLPEEKTGLFKIEAVFAKNPNLFIGKFITVELHINYTKGISVLFNQLTNKYGKTFLFILDKDQVKLKEVKILNTFGNKVVVDGVSPGEKFVIYSDTNLNDGDQVTVEENMEIRQPRRGGGGGFAH